RLSVIAQWRTRPRLLFALNRAAFTPSPAVDSALIELVPIPAPEPACGAATLSRVTAAAFGQRRKMLRQSLKSLHPQPERLLAAAGLEPTLRGEALSIAEFAHLAVLLERLGA